MLNGVLKWMREAYRRGEDGREERGNEKGERDNEERSTKREREKEKTLRGKKLRKMRQVEVGERGGYKKKRV